MYERLLNKTEQPEINEFIEYCGKTKSLFIKLNDYLLKDLQTESLMRFPYGNNYGWGIKYTFKKKLICDVFAEEDAFTVMLRLENIKFNKAYNEVSDYTKKFIDNKYPCGEGGYIHYRVLEDTHLLDIEKLLLLKITK